MNSLYPAFYMESNNEDHHQFFGQMHHQVASSSSSYSCQFYFTNSTQDLAGYRPTQAYLPQRPLEDNNSATHDEVENKVGNNALKLSLGGIENGYDQVQKNVPDKWMSSKMKVMQKMKKSDGKRGDHSLVDSASNMKFEDQKLDHSSSMEAEYSSNSSSNYSNTPVRVCSDCNTTKTPLWRSGPKGPKSLCNACGIRQRKARRALAAAAAENGTHFAATTSATPTKVKIKLPHKDKTTTTKNNNNVNYAPQPTVPFKKRCKVASANPVGTSQQQKPKKPSFEDFLVNLSKNLAAIHNVFPQDEKEAAILLMALSCGLVHG